MKITQRCCQMTRPTGIGIVLLGFLLMINFTSLTPPAFAQQDNHKDPVDWVNPLIGSANADDTGYGATIPGVARPFGMTQWCAMTRENHIGVLPYHHQDSTIIGFIGTHQPNKAMGDYGFVSIMPVIATLKIAPQDRKLSFRHHLENSSPYYYSVVMQDENNKVIRAELTATERCAILRFTFPVAESSFVVIDASREPGFKGYIQIDPSKNEIAGYNQDRQSAPWGPPLENFRGYFVIRFEQPFSAYGTWRESQVDTNSTTQIADHCGAYVAFSRNDIFRQISMKIGTSFISFDQARKNLDEEIPHWNIQNIKEQGRGIWNETLTDIQIKGGTPEQRTLFYTAMHRAHLLPRIFHEAGQYYSAFDDRIHRGISYNDFSFQNTFRTVHPLLVLTESDRVPAFITSMLQMYDEGGWIPKRPNPTYSNMGIGTHSDAVISDAFMKGIRRFNLQKAYKAMYKNAMTPPVGDEQNEWSIAPAPWKTFEARGGLSWYKKSGFVAADKTAASVSRTLEYAYQDYCISQVADVMGKTLDFEALIKRTLNYRNLYHPIEGRMRPKNADGTWANSDEGAFLQGDAEMATLSVIHDIPGLIELFGGPIPFSKKLDDYFANGRYHHAWETGHHIAYLYNYCGEPWKTQEKVLQILTEKYRAAPDGLCGDDGYGALSAWYVFSAIGIYPVTSGNNLYALTSPLFEEITIKMGAPFNNRFTIIAKDASEDNKYIQTAQLDGKNLTTPFLRHNDLIKGNRLVLKMGPTPNLDWK